MEVIANIFFTSGILALTLMIATVSIPFLRPYLKGVNPRKLLVIHKFAGIGALLSAMIHALLYYIFLK
ncbi:MAG: ferric reductase-like transmembrane domain-containing protein [Synergistetes bacterium]|nr:ferric reductase-like transmembrane domain-containing protein [Synergistota bacterium]